jgi:hypothetical protein
MASAASLKIFSREGDNTPRNSKTNNAGIKVGEIDPLIPPGVGAYADSAVIILLMCRPTYVM